MHYEVQNMHYWMLRRSTALTLGHTLCAVIIRYSVYSVVLPFEVFSPTPITTLQRE